MKQVIIIRKDLNMRKGKMIAMACHATIEALLYDCLEGEGEMDGQSMDILIIPYIKEIRDWLEDCQKKIVVGCDSEEELLELQQQAKDAELINELVIDSGFTEFYGVPTKTALAIGPGEDEKIDKITGHLKLL